MGLRIPLISFNAGELSPQIDARSDVEQYRNGCRHLENMIPRVYGSAERRPGTKYVDESKDSETTIRLVSFVYSSSIAYIMEFGNEYIRIFYDGSVLMDNSNEVVIYTPYQTADLFQLQFKQLNDVVWIIHPSYEPRKLTRTTATTFELSIIPFHSGPFLLRNDLIDPEITDTSTMTCDVTTVGSVGTLTCSAAIFDNDHIGGYFKLVHPRAVTSRQQDGNGTSSTLDVKGTFRFKTKGVWTGTVTLQRRENSDSDDDWEDFRKQETNFNLTTVENSDNVEYRINASISSGSFNGIITVDNSIQEGIVQIDGVNSTTSAQITVIKALANTNATKRWAEGAWSDLRGYPTSLTFFKNRAVYAGSTKVAQEGEWSDYGGTWTAKDSNRNWGDVKMSADGQYQLAYAVSGTLYVSTDYGANWTSKESSRNWSSIAVSYTGQYMTAVVNGNNVYVSSNYGGTWAAKDSNRNWGAVAMSKDGKYQTAVVGAGNPYISSDYGETWTVESPTNVHYIAMSDSGRYQTVTSASNGYIYVSSDYGVNWTTITIGGTVQDFRLIAVSASGKYQLTHINGGGKTYVSADYGATWTDNNYTATQWNANAISDNGKYMVGVGSSNKLYVSNDYGSSWTQAMDTISPADVAMSADGKYMTAVVSSGQIYVSEDYGVTWTATDSSRSWNNIAISSTGLYQTATVYGYQIYVSNSGNLIFSYGTGSGTQTVWFSKVGDYENFDEGTNDSDSFSITLTTSEEIRWIEALESIIVGTAANEFWIGTNDINTPITPLNWNAREQTHYGCRNIQALKISDTLLFVDFVGRKVREMSYSDEVRKYISPDLTALAEHITSSGIVNMAYQRNPDSIVWFVLDDGSLISMTYEREHNVVAWAKHPLGGTDVVVQSVCVIPSTDEDEIWLSVQRDIGGNVTYIEKMMPRDFGTDLSDAFFVDCGITDTGGSTTISGLDHLEGEELVVLGDGAVQTEGTAGDFTVSSGEITVPSGLTTVHAGLASTYKLEPMRPVVFGAGGSSQGAKVNVPIMGISFYNTTGAEYGTSDTNLYDISWSDERWVNNSSIDGLFTGDVKVSVEGGFTIENNLIISGSDPTPCTVRAMIPIMDITGI